MSKSFDGHSIERKSSFGTWSVLFLRHGASDFFRHAPSIKFAPRTFGNLESSLVNGERQTSPLLLEHRPRRTVLHLCKTKEAISDGLEPR